MCLPFVMPQSMQRSSAALLRSLDRPNTPIRMLINTSLPRDEDPLPLQCDARPAGAKEIVGEVYLTVKRTVSTTHG